MNKFSNIISLSLIGALLVVSLINVSPALAQRDNDDDFDDAGFDDSGYGSQPNRDTEESNQQPQNYSPNSEEDLDDDDDVDETNVRPQVAPEVDREQRNQQQQHQHQSHQQAANGFYQPQVNGPQRFYSPANSLMLPNVHYGQPIGAQYGPIEHQRYRRSLDGRKMKDNREATKEERDIEDSQRPLVRNRRYAKHYIGPVYTYVKTDKHAHYKWGVKHKVGKHYGRK